MKRPDPKVTGFETIDPTLLGIASGPAEMLHEMQKSSLGFTHSVMAYVGALALARASWSAFQETCEDPLCHACRQFQDRDFRQEAHRLLDLMIDNQTLHLSKCKGQA